MANEPCINCNDDKPLDGLLRNSFVQDAQGNVYQLINDNCDVEVTPCVDCNNGLPLAALQRAAMVCDPVTGLTYVRTYNPEPCGGGGGGGGQTILYRNTATQSWNISKGASQDIFTQNILPDWNAVDLYIEYGFTLNNMAVSKAYDLYFDFDTWGNTQEIGIGTTASFAGGQYALCGTACIRKVLNAADSNNPTLIFSNTSHPPIPGIYFYSQGINMSNPLPALGNFKIFLQHANLGSTQALAFVLWHLKIYTLPIS